MVLTQLQTCERAPMLNADDLALESRDLAAAPLVNHFLERLDLEGLLRTYVPERKFGRKAKLSTARTLRVMVCNVLLSRLPLYAVPAWLEGYVPEFFGLREDEIELLNDDRIGRALDRFYEADTASFVTAVVRRAVEEFDVDLAQIHNDTTTVTFSGEYLNQKPKKSKRRPPLITFGHNKDHRPDLKQLLYALTISADGAVPVHFKTYDGNVTDDKTHKDTWSFLRRLVGSPSFVYVADSKLCTRENMEFIVGEGGTFITVLPRSRKEDEVFRERLAKGTVPWTEIRRDKHSRQKDGPDSVYEVYEPEEATSDGYRILWFRSSRKAELDQVTRAKRLDRARRKLEELEQRTGRNRLRSGEAGQAAADKVLKEEEVEGWLQVEAREYMISSFRQKGPGRPGKSTKYKRVDTPAVYFEVTEDVEAIQGAGRMDGIFPLVTNDLDMTAREVLDKYKYQPFLEKRNEQLKSVLNVAPVLLKSPERVAALLAVYFLAALVFALIERELRRRMKEAEIESLPLYPEERKCMAPTTEVIFNAVARCRRHQLLDADGAVVRTFHDPLSETAQQTLRLLGVSLKPYGV